MNKSMQTFTSELGRGKGMKGSGVAIGMAALMATQLLLSVCKITKGKSGYEVVSNELAELIPVLDDTVSVFTQLMEQDEKVVTEYVQTKVATVSMLDVPLELAHHSIGVLALGVPLMDKGFSIMRGDVMTALQLLLSAGNAALFIVNENLSIPGIGGALYEQRLAALKSTLEGLKQQVDDFFHAKK